MFLRVDGVVGYWLGGGGMLRRVFGEEWEEWHRKTRRFVPFVF